MPEPDVLVAPVDALAARCVALVAERAAVAIVDGRRWSLAISGGSIAATILPVLVRAPLPWASCDVLWVDERAVAPDDADSNFGGVRSLWHAHAPQALLHRMHGEHDDIDEGAASYERTMRLLLGEFPRLDVVVSGTGEDGHVASLFPGHPAIAETERLVVAVRDAPKPPPRRLTMTFPALLAAHHVVIVALGEGKASAIARALVPGARDLPVSRLLRDAGRSTLLLDPAAASHASGR